MWDDPAHLPYCGAPPAPEALWSRWNLDPVLIGALLALAAVYGFGAWRLARGGQPVARGEQGAYYAGWAIAAVALVSPLCALSVSLFSARVGQHMALALAAAPLVAAGRPAGPFMAALGWRESPAEFAAPLGAAGLFAVVLWFWHAPAPYAATFASPVGYWAMHVTLFAAALWLWSGLLARAPGRLFASVAAGLVSTVQMGLLGALITLAPRPIYAPHALTTAAWGLTPLQDQQLGGGIMWVPGCAAFLAASLLVLWLALRRAEWGTARPAAADLR